MNAPPENGQSQARWVVVQPGLFQYPLAAEEKPALLADRCCRCKRVFFPKRRLCPACFSTEMEDIWIRGRGLIYSAAVVHIPSPTGIAAPYAYGYVDMEDEDVRVFGLFSGDRPESFHAGREVELAVGPVSTDNLGRQVVGYQFVPVLKPGDPLGD